MSDITGDLLDTCHCPDPNSCPHQHAIDSIRELEAELEQERLTSAELAKECNRSDAIIAKVREYAEDHHDGTEPWTSRILALLEGGG